MFYFPRSKPSFSPTTNTLGRSWTPPWFGFYCTLYYSRYVGEELRLSGYSDLTFYFPGSKPSFRGFTPPKPVGEELYSDFHSCNIGKPDGEELRLSGYSDLPLMYYCKPCWGGVALRPPKKYNARSKLSFRGFTPPKLIRVSRWGRVAPSRLLRPLPLGRS